MNNPVNTKLNKRYRNLTIFFSVAIPIIVAILFGVHLDIELPIFLPPIYASINALTSLILLIALWAVKTKRFKLHEKLIKWAMLFSLLFLLMYVIHHMTSKSTPFGGEGFIRWVYYTVLISHILLSIVVIPLVLLTFFKGVIADYPKHKKLARIAFPLWLYVTISGVCVYLLIAPYYV